MKNVTQSQLTEQLLATYDHINERINRMADATQQDVDNLTNQVNQVSTDLSSTRDKLQAEIDSLANQGVDVTALQNAVAPLDQVVNDLGNLTPTQPGPGPEPTA